MRRYNPQEIEPKWQKIWEETELYKTDITRTADKFYTIPMLPYPSGDLHIGHWFNFVGADSVARWHRMVGQNVLTTIGFDAFGLPAENAAIARGIQPAKWTRSNIASMTKQLHQIGASYDWSHSLTTCDPSFYRWNQWLFLKLYEQKLAYRKKALVNWCPKDQTVLANEQVVGENNVCERCGTPVVQKELEQWYFKITDYVDRLLDDMDSVDWPARVKTMQENWIGRSNGALIDFQIDGQDKKLSVFTTRPDTIYGATYMVIAPEHPLVDELTSQEQKSVVVDYVHKANRKTELERKEGEKAKTGIFSGSYAINPATKKPIPIWIADYVLMGYGTGAIMAVPAHDERDFEFAKTHELPIQTVIEPVFIQQSEESKVKQDMPFVERQAITAIVKHWQDDKYIGLKWKQVDWDTFITGGVEKGQTAEEAATAEIREETGYLNPTVIRTLDNVHAKFFHVPKNENRFAHFKTFYFELTDGEKKGITEAEQKNHEVVWLSRAEIEAFRLPDSHRYLWEQLLGKTKIHTGEGMMINSGKYNGLDSAEARDKIVADLAKDGIAKEQTNYRLRDWLISRQRYWGTPIPIVYCDKDGIVAVPEDQLPVVLPEDVEFELTGQSPLIHRPDFVDTTCPECGGPAKRETDTMDTFVDSSWYYWRYIDNKNDKMAFDPELVNSWGPVDHYIGGIEHAILHLLYARFITKFLHDNYSLEHEEPFKRLTNQGIILGPDGQKMSKSRGNVVNPDEQVKSYGADSLRLYLMFMGPFDQGGPYSMGGIAGTRRFLERLWALVDEFSNAPDKPVPAVEATAMAAATHRAIKKVTKDMENLSFNTAIASLMGLVNELYKFKSDIGISKDDSWKTSLETVVQLLAPLAPHITEEMWADLGHDSSVHISNWPLWDEKLVAEDMMTIAVQVNGKVRSEITVPADAPKDEILKQAKADAKVAKYLKGASIKKEIYVPGRLISLVTD